MNLSSSACTLYTDTVLYRESPQLACYETLTELYVMETETVFRLNKYEGAIGGGHETCGTNVKDTAVDSVAIGTMTLFKEGEKLNVCMVRCLDSFWSGHALCDKTRYSFPAEQTDWRIVSICFQTHTVAASKIHTLSCLCLFHK